MSKVSMLKQSIEAYRLAARSGSKTKEATALFVLIRTANHVLKPADGLIWSDIMTVINETCESEVDGDEAARIWKFLHG